MRVAEITHENFPIPRVGEILELFEYNDRKISDNETILKEYHQYLVTNIHYWVSDNNYGVVIYVVPIGRNIKK